MTIRCFGLSDIGKIRPVNEDSFLIDEKLGFFAVADGVGGRAKGEVASFMALDEAHAFINAQRDKILKYQEHPEEEALFAVKRLLEGAVQHACYMVFGVGELDPIHQGMSTTVSAMLVLDATTALTAQVGDSRIYRLRNGQCLQITEDHTLINYHLKQGLITPEQARRAKNKNVITRAVGHRDYVQVDTGLCALEPGDRYMLCTDGLHGYLRPREVPEMMAGDELPQVAETLVELCNQRGGRDNITLIFVDVR